MEDAADMTDKFFKGEKDSIAVIRQGMESISSRQMATIMDAHGSSSETVHRQRVDILGKMLDSSDNPRVAGKFRTLVDKRAKALAESMGEGAKASDPKIQKLAMESVIVAKMG